MSIHQFRAATIHRHNRGRRRHKFLEVKIDASCCSRNLLEERWPLLARLYPMMSKVPTCTCTWMHRERGDTWLVFKISIMFYHPSTFNGAASRTVFYFVINYQVNNYLLFINDHILLIDSLARQIIAKLPLDISNLNHLLLRADEWQLIRWHIWSRRASEQDFAINDSVAVRHSLTPVGTSELVMRSSWLQTGKRTNSKATSSQNTAKTTPAFHKKMGLVLLHPTSGGRPGTEFSAALA